jgi:4-amino-4-deoxy-L-arabinose transferase-like glycosyltransferase
VRLAGAWRSEEEHVVAGVEESSWPRYSCRPLAVRSPIRPRIGAFGSISPTRGSALSVGGAFVLAVAMFLPWYSLPGGGLEHYVLVAQNRPVPGTGSAWHSLGIISIPLVGLVLVGVAVALHGAAEDGIRSSLAGFASAYGLLVAVLIFEKIVRRPGAGSLFAGGKETVVGAGGYLGLIAALAIALGALMVAVGRRAHGGRTDDHRPRSGAGARTGRVISAGPTASGAPTTGADTAQVRPASQAGPPLSQADAAPLDRLRMLSLGRPMRVGLAIAAITALYLATRLSFIRHFPYFVDEGTYADWTAQGAASTHQLFISQVLARGPTLPWFAIAWVKLGFSPLIAVRLVSVTSGLLTVGVVGLLGRELGGAAVGWAAAALCVVVPYFVVHDGIGIYEPLVTLIMATALYLQLRLARRPSLRLGVMLGLVLGAGILTKENTVPALALLPVSLACFDFSPSGRRRRLATWLGAAGIAGVMFIGGELILHLSPYYARQVACAKNPFCWPAQSLSGVLEDPFAVSGQAWVTYRSALIGYVTWPLLVAGLVGAVLAWRTRPRLTAVLLTWFIVPFVIALLFVRATAPRHVMYVLPPAIVMIAYAIVRVATWARRALTERTAAIGWTAGAALLLAPALIFDGRVLADPVLGPYPGVDNWQYVTGWPAGSDWQGAADVIRHRGTGRQVVILTPLTPVPSGRMSMLELLFWHEGRYVFASGKSALAGSALATRAQFVITGGYGPSDLSTVLGTDRQALQAQRQFVLVSSIALPKGSCAGYPCGGSLNVYQRPPSQIPSGRHARTGF